MNRHITQPNYGQTGFQNITVEKLFGIITKELSVQSNQIQLKNISTGNVCRSYYIIINNKTQFVLKICPAWFTGSLLREKMLNKFLQSQKLCTPDIVFYREKEPESASSFEMLCTKYIHGTLLSQDPNWIDSFDKIKNFYNITHQKTGSGYGWCHAPWSGSYTTWSDFIEEKFITQEHIVRKCINYNILYEIMLCLKKKYFKPKALIGDFNTSNYIKSDSKIYAFDFQNTLLGDPLFDFAQILAKVPKIDVNDFIKTEIGGTDFHFYEKRLLFFYAICIAGDTLQYHTKKRNLSKKTEAEENIYKLLKRAHAKHIF